MSEATWNSKEGNVFSLAAKRGPGSTRPINRTDIGDGHGAGDSNLKRLREVAPAGVKGKPRLMGPGGLNPLASFLFEVRTWLGLPERGMSDAERTAAIKKAGVTGVLCVLFVSGFIAVTSQTMHARSDAAAVHTESAEASLEPQALAGTTQQSVIASDIVSQVTTADEGYDAAEPIEGIPIP